MKKWEKLEKDCFQQLSTMYGDYIKILPYGKSDSTKPDLKIILPNGKSFFIEIKSPNAQCCQFVLFPDEKKKSFYFSPGNKTQLTQSCSQIIQYMNSHYLQYHKPNQKGIKIDIKNDVLYNLVNEYYTPKMVKYFMTQTKNGDFIIFPSSQFKDYFNITAWYRRKKSGSSEPTQKHIPEIKQNLIYYSINGDINIVEMDKPRCFLMSDNDNLHKERLICTNYTYELKENKNSQILSQEGFMSYIYEIRKLSNTNNPNVICQLELKNIQQSLKDLQSFESFIMQNQC